MPARSTEAPAIESKFQLGPFRGYLAKHRWAQVALLIGTLVILTFFPYLSGKFVINGDINAHYMSDSHYWWLNGGIFDPPNWIPYAWMGRPGGSNLQDGSYVLIQGLVQSIAGWSPLTAALTMALGTAFGSLGAYVLVLRLCGGHQAAMLALVAQFYAPAVFANAQWPDFHRGVTLLPWLLLLASPLWFWGRRWAMPVACLLLWQIIVGVYPGQLIAAAYCVGVWVIGWLVVSGRQNRGWLWRLVVTFAIASSLSAVKMVPALMSGTGERGWEEQRILLGIDSLATVFFPYDNPSFAWDVALRPFFVVIPILVFLFVVPWKSKLLLPGNLMGGMSLGLMVLVAIARPLAESFPGLSLSRVLVNDLRNFAVFSVIIAGALGWERYRTRRENYRFRIYVAVAVIVSVAVLALFTLEFDGWGIRGLVGTIIPFLLLAILTWWLSVGHSSLGRISKSVFSGVLVVAIVSGMTFAFTVTSTWASSRPSVEEAHFGQTLPVGFNSSPRCDGELERRPPRTLPDVEASEYWHDNEALIAAFNCSYAVSGYVNIPGNPTLRDQAEEFVEDEQGQLLTFVGAAGSITPAAEKSLEKADLSESCLVQGECKGLEFQSVFFDPDGKLSYEVTTQQPVEVLLNESYYDGWQALWCPIAQDCLPLEVTSSEEQLISMSLPQGTGQLKLEFVPEGRDALRTLFVGGILVATLTVLLPTARRQAVS